MSAAWANTSSPEHSGPATVTGNRWAFADPGAAAEDWQRRKGAMQINHMVVVTEELARILHLEDTTQIDWRFATEAGG